MTATPEGDLERRRLLVRQRQLVLALEQWGSDYVGGVAEASDAELAWLREQPSRPVVARTDEEWHQLRRQQGREANAAASAAFLAGDYAAARDLLDEARAYGAIPEKEWQELHRFIEARVTEAGARAA